MQKITIIILALLLLLSIGFVQIKAKEEGSDKMEYERNEEASEINADGIRAKMSDDIFEEFKRLVENQVEPWCFFNSKGIHVKRFDGQDISISGFKYSDQTKDIFLKYIEPFIEDVIKRKIDETIELAKDKKVHFSTVLGSTEANLSGGIDTVYHKMQEIDRRLRGGGNPDSVPMRDVSLEIKTMNDFLDRQIIIAEDLNFGIVETEKTKMQCIKKWAENNIVIVILLIIIVVIGVLAKFKKDIFTLFGWGNQQVSKENANTYNIFAEVSRDGEILRANEFPWKIKKTKNEEGDIFYTIIDRRGDATAVTVIPDTPKYAVYQSWEGMVIKYTCPEEKISDFKIVLKY